MPVIAPAAEFVALPAGGRSFVAERKVRLGDVDAGARIRFDAIARLLQDVATDDADDAALDRTLGWLVRRTMVEVSNTPRLGEGVELTTFCSGYGRSWAERRTSIRGERGARVEAVSLWVSIDSTTGRPTTLGEEFLDVYGSAAAGRKVSARLALAPPPDMEHGDPWPIRVVDIDPYRHVNNAAQWAAVDETMGQSADRRGTAQIEFVAPIEPDMDVMRIDAGPAGWLVARDGSDEPASVRTAFRFDPVR